MRSKRRTPSIEALREKVRARAGEGGVIIPVPDYNRFGMRCGYHNHAELVGLLRDHKTNPEAIQFIADMME